MIDAIEPLAAKARLALSRAELMAAMGYETVTSELDGAPNIAELPTEPSADGIGDRLARSMVGRWWRRHPMSGVVELAQPLLESYAHKHPAKLIAFGAGTGALLWVLKPWKLLSVATVVTLVIKNSDLPGIIADVAGKIRRTAPPDVAAPRP